MNRRRAQISVRQSSAGKRESALGSVIRRGGPAFGQVLPKLIRPLVDPGAGLAEVSEVLLRQARKLTRSAHGFVSTIDPRTGNHIGHTLNGMMPEACGVTTRTTVLPCGPDGLYAGLWGHALNTRRGFFTNDAAHHPAAKGVPEGHIPLKRFLGVPVLLNKEVVGQIALANPPRDYSAQDLRNIEGLGQFYALAIQRMRFEEALKRERDFAAAVTSNAAVGVMLTDARSGRLVRANRKFCDILGYSPQEIESLTLQRITHPDDWSATSANLKRLLAGETREVNMEKRYLDKSGLVVWASVSVSPMTGRHEGEPELHIAVVQDITLRKAIEAELAAARRDLEGKVEERTAELQSANSELLHQIELRRLREAELIEAESRYRTVADFTYDWEYWGTPEGTLRYCSPSCERVTGYTTEELAGNPRLIDEIVWPEDQALWREHICSAQKGLGPRTLEFRIRSKSGAMRWIEHSCQPVILESGAWVGVRASNRDITDRKVAEMTTQHLRQELGLVSRVSTAGQLAAALAHELNQPLGAIVCNAQAADQFMVQAPPNLEEVRAALSDIQADGKRAGQVIQRLRAMFRRTDPQRSPLDLNRLVQETLELLHSEFLLKSVAIQTGLGPELPRVSGNSIELQQVLINLTMNALDAMSAQDPETRRLRVETGQAAAGAVQVRVQDTGSGLSAEQLERLGEPFFTSKPRGMGMGLAISRSIVEAHSGRLWAVNNPERGATLILELPPLGATGP